jgi:hypothetical protein
MQALHDIFSIWDPNPAAPEPTKAARALAAALNEKQDTVYRWLRRKRIPDTAWQSIIDAAIVRGKVLTIADLHAANRPAKPRGRATHKARSARRRRNETRIES